MHQVMPGVDHFTEWGSDPTVMRAFGIDAEAGEEALLGYVFHTADVPPERSGYSAPIGTLVGLALDGSVTGMRITDYRTKRQHTGVRFKSSTRASTSAKRSGPSGTSRAYRGRQSACARSRSVCATRLGGSPTYTSPERQRRLESSPM